MRTIRRWMTRVWMWYDDHREEGWALLEWPNMRRW